jgi:hypothetical protein
VDGGGGFKVFSWLVTWLAEEGAQVAAPEAGGAVAWLTSVASGGESRGATSAASGTRSQARRKISAPWHCPHRG